MKKSTLLFCVFALLVSVASAQDLSKVEFRLTDFDGKEQSFQEFLKSVRGNEQTPRKGAIFVSFWAMWCEPCKKEMIAIKPIYEKYKGKNFHYIAINTDKPKSLAKVKSYVTTQELPFNHWSDPNNEVFKKLNGQTMPYSLLLDEQGKVIKKSVGFMPGDENELDKAIGEAVE